jgi:tetratricopeptide (TPR) repeat protein
VAGKVPAIIAVLPLLVQLVACAASPATQPDHSATGAVAKHEEAKAAPVSAQDAKTFAQAVQRGDAAWQAGELDRAVYYYVLALERSPQDAPTLAKIGAIEEGRGNLAQAEKAFEMAHSADPQEPRIAERLARLYMRDEKFDRAGELYAQVLALNPQRSRALDGMGEVCLARAEYVQAISYFDRALQGENADTAAVLTHRGHAKLLNNDLQGAEADLRAALAAAPRQDAMRYLAELQVRRGDTAAALESLLRVMDTAQAYNQVGVLLMHVNNYRDAHEYFAKAVSASPVWFEEAQRNLALVDAHRRDAGEAAGAGGLPSQGSK